jgi:hypothetical protein
MSEMREPTAGGSHPASDPASSSTGGAASSGAASYGHPDEAYGFAAGSPLLRLGGALGIAACLVGLLILVAACAGLNRVVVLSLVPVGLSIPGLVVSMVGAIKDKAAIVEDTHVLHALFANIAGLLGGLLEMAAWLRWPLFPQ